MKPASRYVLLDVRRTRGVSASIEIGDRTDREWSDRRPRKAVDDEVREDGAYGGRELKASTAKAETVQQIGRRRARPDDRIASGEIPLDATPCADDGGVAQDRKQLRCFAHEG